VNQKEKRLTSEYHGIDYSQKEHEHSRQVTQYLPSTRTTDVLRTSQVNEVQLPAFYQLFSFRGRLFYVDGDGEQGVRAAEMQRHMKLIFNKHRGEL
jgi:hypothetical protein